ncbi:MAG TPA: hypothetical protein VLA34_09615, partial [Candidatus Krumholzibacterium sp.]|nr:hypothetical protein [Candidatus Krumholzibacterium sp.]
MVEGSPHIKENILLIGPFPPPIGGETVSTSKLLGSRYWKEAGVRISTINLYGKGRIRLQGDRLTPMNILRAFRILLQFLFKIHGKDRVLVWITRRSLCSLGLAMILISRFFGKPVIVKVFGSYLVEQINEYGPRYRRFIVSVLSRVERILPQTDAIARGLVEDTGLDGSLVTRFPNFLMDDSLDSPVETREFEGRCVFVGHIKEEKGVFDIIEALGSKTGV